MLENVFKIVYNSIGNDINTLKQRRNFSIFLQFLPRFSTKNLGRKNFFKKSRKRYQEYVCFDEILILGEFLYEYKRYCKDFRSWS